MAAVNPPAEWVTAQTLDPLAEVDLVKLNATLVKGYPTSATPTVAGTSGTDTVKATTTRSKK